MSSDLTADSAPTYAVVDKKFKLKNKAPQKPERADPAMEMYFVIDNSKKTRSASGKPLTDSVDGVHEAPTYDIIDHQSGGPDPSSSSFDRTDIPSMTPQVATIPAKKERSPPKECTGVVLSSFVLFVLLSVILAVFLIALVVAFIQIVNLQSQLNTLKGSSPTFSATMSTTDNATGSPLVSTTDALNANLTVLQMNLEILKGTVNSLTNETTTDIN